MFKGKIVWKGLVYTLFMLFGKLVTGIWLIRLNISFPKLKRRNKSKHKIEAQINNRASQELKILEPTTKKKDGEETTSHSTTESSTSPTVTPQEPKTKKPLSLYPAAMLGTAMMARGEIGFLIASLAETKGIFSSSGEGTKSSEIYLVVVWAVVLCTVIGPVSVGTLVKRVRRMRGERITGSGREDPLGIWGVS